MATTTSNSSELLGNITPKAYAFTYEELLTLLWRYNKYSYKFKAGYSNIDGDTDYFGTDTECMTTVAVNANYAGTTHITIKVDGGTRTAFHGHVTSLAQLQMILQLVQ